MFCPAVDVFLVLFKYFSFISRNNDLDDGCVIDEFLWRLRMRVIFLIFIQPRRNKYYYFCVRAWVYLAFIISFFHTRRYKYFVYSYMHFFFTLTLCMLDTTDNRLWVCVFLNYFLVNFFFFSSSTHQITCVYTRLFFSISTLFMLYTITIIIIIFFMGCGCLYMSFFINNQSRPECFSVRVFVHVQFCLFSS